MRLNEIDIIRCLVIVALIAYHSFAPFTGSWESLPDLDNGWYRWLGKFAYSGMLETFVCISGYVFAFQFSRKPQPLRQLIPNKIKRLYIPCLIWGVITILAITPDLVAELAQPSTYLRIAGGTNHLWFLPMLFWCFMLEQAIIRIGGGTTRNQTTICAILAILAMLPYPTLPLRFNNALYYIFFFHLGLVLFLWRDKLKNRIMSAKKHSLLIVSLLYLSLFVAGSLIIAHFAPSEAPSKVAKAAYLSTGHSARLIYSTVAVLIYFIIGFRLCEKITSNKMKFVRNLSINSFGIYLLQEILLRILYYRFDISSYTGMLTPWIGFAIVLPASYILTKALHKNRVTSQIC